MASVGGISIDVALELARLNQGVADVKSRLGEIEGASKKSEEALKQVGAAGEESAGHLSTLKEGLTNAKEALEALLIVEGVKKLAESFKEAVDATNEWAFSIDKLSKITGQSTEQASILAVAAKQQGVSIDVVEGAYAKLARTLATNEKAVVNVAGSIRNAHGQLLPMDEILQRVVTGLESFRAGADRDAAATTVLGRSWQSLVDLQRLTPEAMREATEAAKNFGLVIGVDGVAHARAFEEAQNTTGLALLGLKQIVGEQLRPEIEKADKAFQDFVKNNRPQIADFATTAINDIKDLLSELAKLAQWAHDHNDLFANLAGIAGVALIATGNIKSGAALIGAGLAAGTDPLADLKKQVAERDKSEAARLKLLAEFTPGGASDNGPTLGSTSIVGAPAAGTRSFVPENKKAEEEAELTKSYEKHLQDIQRLVGEQQQLNAVQLAAGDDAAKVAKAEEQQASANAALNLAAAAGLPIGDKRNAILLQEAQQLEALKLAYKQRTEDLKLWNDLQTEATKLVQQDRSALEQYNDTLVKLDAFFEAGLITASQYFDGLEKATTELSKAQEPLFKDQKKNAEEWATTVNGAIDKVGESFLTAGASAKSFGETMLSIADDVEKLIIKLAILNPIENAITGAFTGTAGTLPTIGAGGNGGGILSGLGSALGGSGLLGSLGDWIGGLGDTGGAVSSGGFFDTIGSFVAALGGAAGGADFDVGGGYGGGDSQLVAFRATPGERVIATPPAGSRSGDGGNGFRQSVNVHNYGNQQIQTRSRNGGRDLDILVGEAMARDFHTNGPGARALQQTHGVQRTSVGR